MGRTLIHLISVCIVLAVSSGAIPKPYFPNVADEYDTWDTQQSGNSKCGYESCPVPVPGMLNLHIVAHTHDDVGWLKTVDQYYYGSKTYIQKAGVQYILDSAINALAENPSRKFIYVETAYLWKWWQEQTEAKRQQVREFIENGQLEIIGGAWSMNDEAAAHYHSILDQFTWGFRRLNDTFGKCATPKIGWQIDPFGHSREMASMMAQFGFDGLFFGRLDYQDKIKRMAQKTGEMIWRGSPNLGKSSDLFTGVLYNQYQAPSGFCFDVLCTDEPIIDDKNSSEYNVERRILGFIRYANEQAQHYKTKNVILTMGGDFTYQDAPMYFKNLDKLIRYINELQKDGSMVNAFYSTPSCYLKALHDTQTTWPTKTDDFFPYGSDKHSYWTGYFTSRPTSKYMERQGNNMLQVCKQLAAITDINESNYPDELPGLIELREVMGVMQHHDAITGTEKQHVADDYARLLSKAIDQCSNIVERSLSKVFTAPSPFGPDLNLQQCALNISQCEVSEKSSQFATIVYNPSSQKIDKYVRVPVFGSQYVVHDPEGVKLPTQVVPIPKSVQNIPGRFSTANYELIFFATDIPPLGYKTYHISISNDGPQTYVSRPILTSSIGNDQVRLILESSGKITHLVTQRDQIPFTQQYLYYEGEQGNNMIAQNRSSGAYIFRPKSDALQFRDAINSTVYKGPLVQEIHQVISPWVSNIVRIYATSNVIEFDWTIGPLPVQDKVGKEVITRFKTDLNTKGVFYTDSNGRELIRRVRDKRETWEYDPTEPIAGNYYPITSRIVLKDEESESEFAVFNDRAQGGGSLADGELELMLHRRLLHDDAFGVEEPLNETAFGTQGLVARGTNYVLSSSTVTSPSFAVETRQLAAQIILAPVIYFVRMDNVEWSDFNRLFAKEFNSILLKSSTLPANVQILTLEPWKKGTLLLRLEHIMEKGEDPILSKPACVNIQNMFTTFKVTDVKETSLGGNQWIEDVKRLEWNSSFDYLDEVNRKSNSFEYSQSDRNRIRDYYRSKLISTNQINKTNSKFNRNYLCTGTNSKFEIQLEPMQIRTFILDVVRSR